MIPLDRCALCGFDAHRPHRYVSLDNLLSIEQMPRHQLSLASGCGESTVCMVRDHAGMAVFSSSRDGLPIRRSRPRPEDGLCCLGCGFRVMLHLSATPTSTAVCHNCLLILLPLPARSEHTLYTVDMLHARAVSRDLTSKLAPI